MAGKPIILVTGANGFIARRIVLELLSRAYAVRGTVRDTNRSDEIRDAIRPHLKAATLGRDLKFVAADLMSDEGWAYAMEGARAVIHTASPFPMHVPKDPQELIRPAVEGTVRVLRAAHAAGVRRVVLTSSAAAIMYGHGRSAEPRHYDETDWTNLNDPLLAPYNRSKTTAELAAWQVAKETGLELVVINPTLVLGPLMDAQNKTSVEIVRQLLAGGFPALPDIGFGIVDVRDVAEMHVNALANPAVANKRFFATAGFYMVEEIAAMMRELYPDRRFPRRRAPDWLLRLVGRFDKRVEVILDDLGVRRVLDNNSGRALLGHDFIPAKEAIRATAESLLEFGIVRR